MINRIAQRFSPKYLRFYYYLKKAKTVPRYKKTQVSFPGYSLEVADLLSFAWQYWEIILKECYLFKTDSVKPLIIDCGANIGLSALYFSRLYPNATIKAIEADKSIAAICKKNLDVNKANHVQLIDKAAWINNGFISFNQEGADGGKITESNNSAQVACFDFAEFLEPLASIDLLKMDIEGAETAIIKHSSSQLKKVKHLFIEYHSSTDAPQQLGDMLNILRENGFRYYIEDLKKKPSPFLPATNNASFDLQLNIYATNNQF